LLEDAFEVSRGHLAVERARGRLIFEATPTEQSEATALAVFEPRLLRASLFRVRSLDALAPMLTAIRTHAAEDEFVNLKVENDERLRAALLAVGATIRAESVHFFGKL
jgi:hypothetical protein